MAQTYIPAKPCKRGHLLRYKRGGQCVACIALWNSQSLEKNRANVARWRKANPERAKLSIDTSKAKKPDLYRAIQRKNNKKWAQNNRPYRSALQMKRQAAKLKRTPFWLVAEDYDRIAELYKEAARLTRWTGKVHHVDHIIPLQGKKVSGLHVPGNLRVIPAAENQKKTNKWPLQH